MQDAEKNPILMQIDACVSMPFGHGDLLESDIGQRCRGLTLT